MSTILETLQNADYNLRTNGFAGIEIARSQLHNAVILLEKEYDLYDDIDAILDRYIDVGIEGVPLKEDD